MSPPQDVATKQRSSLVLRLRLGDPASDSVEPEGTRLTPRDIRVLAQRKLSSRSCSLRRALLIQNALPLLDLEEAEAEAETMLAAMNRGRREQEQVWSRVVSPSSSSSEEEQEQEQEEMEEEEQEEMEEEHEEQEVNHTRYPSPPTIIDPSTAAAGSEEDDVRSGTPTEPELDACYLAAMQAFDEIRESDLLLCDAEAAGGLGNLSAAADGEESCGELDVLASAGVACIEEQGRAVAAMAAAAAVLPSPSQARKRCGSSVDDDVSPKCTKPVRSSSPCGLTQRVSGAAAKLSCSRNVFSVIQC